MADKIELPQPVQAVVKAQNSHDSVAYIEVFEENAIVHDEGKGYHGRNEIKKWNEESNKKYHTTLEPIKYSEEETESVLTALVTGTFDGSPLPLTFRFALKDEKITRLHITG
jgi:hypothetical protein